MKVILFGATGMIGQGVLRECLRDDQVTAVLVVGRARTGHEHPKLRELVRAYRRVTHDLTLAVARALLARNPQLRFGYVSGAGTDSAERSRMMWARVKGRTENALRELMPATAYLFRPGFIQPRHGVRSKTRLYRAVDGAPKPVLETRDINALAASS